MLTPDEQLALGILDALDDRYGPEVSPHLLTLQQRQKRTWSEQQYRMIQVLVAWLDRQKDTVQRDDALQRAISVLHERLADSETRLRRDIEAMDVQALSHR
jgi:hypothetical protein